MSTVALFGAAGVIGQSIAAALSSKGQPYRVVGRTEASLRKTFGADPLAEIVTWNPDSPASVQAAATGVETLIYMVGVNYGQFELHPELMRKTLAGAIAAGVKNIIEEPDNVCNVGDRHALLQLDQLDRSIEPQAQQPGVRCHADTAFEELQKSKPVKAQEKGQVLQGDLVAQVRLHEVAHTRKLLRQQRAGDDLRRWLQQPRKQGLEEFHDARLLQQRIG